MTDTQQPIRVNRDAIGASAHDSNQNTPQTNSNVAASATTIQDQETSKPLTLGPVEHTGQTNTDRANRDAKQPGSSKDTDRFDRNFTQNVINATGPKTSPRMRKVMASLIQHVHDFARENEITVDEWMVGVEMGHILSTIIFILSLTASLI